MYVCGEAGEGLAVCLAVFGSVWQCLAVVVCVVFLVVLQYDSIRGITQSRLFVVAPALFRFFFFLSPPFEMAHGLAPEIQ